MTRNGVFMLGVIAVMVVIAEPALAQVPSTGVFDEVLNRFSPQISQWEAVIKKHAIYLFWTLATISLVWTGVVMALKQSDIQEYFAEVIKFIITTGLFWWLLDNGPAIGADIVSSLRLIGAEAAGVPGTLNPSSLMNIGFDVLERVIDKSTLAAPIDSFVMFMLAIVLLILFALIGVEVIILILSGWILGYAGVIFLGFGGGRWTSDMAVAYYKSLLQLGVQIMAVILLMAVGKDVLTSMADTIGTNITIRGVAVLFVAVIVFYALFTRIPAMLSGLVNGGALQSPFAGAGGVASLGGAVTGATAAALGAASLASGMVGATMAAAKEAASGAGGAASAVMSAFGGAVADRASGSGAFSGGQWGGGGNAVTSGMGRAAQMAASAGGHLASGAASWASEKASSALADAKSDFADSMKASTGGQIADQINAMTLADIEPSGDSAMDAAIGAFDPNGQSGGGWQSSFVSDEVKDFVNNGGSSASTEGGGRGNMGPDHWAMAAGGVSGLSGDQLQAAQTAFDTWKEGRGKNSTYGFEQYVNYAQTQQAKRMQG
ncbi:type IV secretion system protein TrbL [Azospirillum brasilense]|nr:type IV secretion system protein TrbL [Azospirillum brasilense]